MTFKMRPINPGEKLYVAGLGYLVFHQGPFDFYWKSQSIGWVIYDKYPSCMVGFVRGIPGKWSLCYYHVEKGLLSERIIIPRTAIHRMVEVIKENTL